MATTPGEFENGGFTLKTLKYFPLIFTPEAFRNHKINVTISAVFEKLLFQNVFLPHKHAVKSRRFQIPPRFQERFGKAPFS